MMGTPETPFSGASGSGAGGEHNSLRGSIAPSECGSLDVTGTGDALMENLNIRSKNEVILNHKTKVSKVKPPGRIVYEWEWDVLKFDKAFPLMLPESPSFGKVKIVKSGKIVAGTDIKRKSDWSFILSETNGKLSWYVHLEKVYKKSFKSVHTAFTFKVVDANGKELYQKPRRFRDFRESFKFGWDEIMELEKLYEHKDAYLKDNTLRIRILFEMFVEADQSQIEAMKQEKDNFAKLMTNDMWRLRTATGTADVHLECEGKVFPVHKLILSARSGAFSRMFDTPMAPRRDSQVYAATAGGDNPPEREVSVSSVSIVDVDPNILEIILDYIYSGNVKPLTNLQILSGVIRASDKFELNDLKSYCFNALMNFVTEENIGSLAVLAYRHNAEKNVRLNINGYCLRNLSTLMKKKPFKQAFKMEPDAFFPDDDCM